MSLKIMVVDGEPMDLKVMRSLIVPLGHAVVTLDNSQQAKQQAEKQRFDVAFIGLPRPDGFDLASQICSSHAGRETTVVMLSVTDDIEMLRKSFGAGASFVLPKPVAAARVIPLLNAMESPGWNEKRHTARLPLFTEVNCKREGRTFLMHSMNISETGMLLRSSDNFELGQEVLLEFKITEVRAALNLDVRIVRKEGIDRVGIEFLSLTPADVNAIQLYVMGRLKKPTSPQTSLDFRGRRLFNG